MKKIISFSVYGPHSLYNDGAYENIAEAKEYFPDWICRFYCDETSPILPKLIQEKDLGNCELVIKKKELGTRGAFWRFSAISDPEAEYILIRDTDQRLSDKDAQVVKHWMESNFAAHRMYEDGTQVEVTLLACAIGFRGGVIINIDQLMEDWFRENSKVIVEHDKKECDRPIMLYGADQVFLREKIWPLIEKNCETYGFNGGIVFPEHKPLKWGGEYMFRRIVPFTNCTQIFGARPGYAYDSERLDQ